MTIFRAQRAAGGAAIYGDESALVYSATLAGLSSASALGSISASYAAPSAGGYTVALDGLTTICALGAISAAYTGPAPVFAASAAPIGHRRSTLRRAPNLSTRTR